MHSKTWCKKNVASFKTSDRELEDFFVKSRLQSMQLCFPHIDKELKRTGVNRSMLAGHTSIQNVLNFVHSYH
jgi:hypothetical protein